MNDKELDPIVANDSSNQEAFLSVASHWTALVADAIGALGIYGVVSWCVEKLHQHFGNANAGMLGWPDSAWTMMVWFLLIAIFWAFVGYTAFQIQKNRTQRIAEIADRRESDLKALLDRTAGRSQRYAQEQANRGLAPLYGYHFESVTHHYKIFNHGKTVSVSEFVFKSDGRVLSKWHRVKSGESIGKIHKTEAKAKAIQGTQNVVVDSKPHKGKSNAWIDEFSFAPNITEKNGPVTLTLTDGYDDQLATAQSVSMKGMKEAHDYLQFSLREPADMLRIILEFEEFCPVDFQCSATYGPGRDELRRESAEASDLLLDEDDGINTKVVLELPHPMIGVEYRISYKVKAG